MRITLRRKHHELDLIRRLVLCLVIALGAGVVSGCGNGGSQSVIETETGTETVGRVEDSTEPAEEPEPEIEELGGQIEPVGTMTVTDERGTTFRETFSIGPLSNGEEAPPPASVLGACDFSVPSQTAQAAFARGEITVSYTEGTIPEQVVINPQGIVEGEELFDAAAAVELGGEWLCIGELGTSYEFQPGETQALPMWLAVGGILSNEHPQVPADVYNTWRFHPVGPPDLLLRRPSTVSGPGAIKCDQYETQLYLYNRSGSCTVEEEGY